ncbi:hypothetical protein DB41_AA00190 [Neochlamydia sp. TUME1]|nr:hypothetical protein DB41_AA00190 [Neochlamydia sp. TUME1]
MYVKNLIGFENLLLSRKSNREFPFNFNTKEEYMASKLQSFSESADLPVDYEGTLTSSLNIPLDEVVLRHFGSDSIICMTLLSGRTIELPLHLNLKESGQAMLAIPEKYYKQSEHCRELEHLLSHLFNNQRSLLMEIDAQAQQLIITPLQSKKNKFKFTFYC